jgi:hypothetical protein
LHSESVLAQTATATIKASAVVTANSSSLAPQQDIANVTRVTLAQRSSAETLTTTHDAGVAMVTVTMLPPVPAAPSAPADESPPATSTVTQGPADVLITVAYTAN